MAPGAVPEPTLHGVGTNQTQPHIGVARNQTQPCTISAETKRNLALVSAETRSNLTLVSAEIRHSLAQSVPKPNATLHAVCRTQTQVA